LTEGGEVVVTEVLERLRDAQNRHDLDAFVACFDPTYDSQQPLHPDRAFVGSQQVRQNWAEIFAGVPDFRAELLRSAEEGDTGWAEWHWHGTRADGTRLDMRGVTIFGIRDDRVVWGRLYLEDVEGGQGIDQAVRHMARGPD
jgi:ketosteroid isomerase-like protein